MGVIGWIVLGIVAGAVVKALPGEDPDRLGGMMLMGVLGALIGGVVGLGLGLGGAGAFLQPGTSATALAAALALLHVYRTVDVEEEARGRVTA
jgi:uncharacterized membrane protein YeaQ/YmgE (transglycosylase-associated protein family)